MIGLEMKKYIRRVYRFIVFWGIDPVKTFKAILGLPQYLKHLISFMKQQNESNVQFEFGKLVPCFGESVIESGNVRGHYFHQDLLVARKIYQNKPKLHVDVGSRIDGFVAHIASFREIEVFDIRPMRSSVANMKFKRADLTGVLDEKLFNYCDSLSCLHALEHFGLGRYGDPVKFNGYLDGLSNLYNILERNGKFYFSIPIGPQRIEFNAHRIFAVEYLLELFNGKYSIDHFSYVDDMGDLHESVQLTNGKVKNNFGCHFGCGIFEMTKL